MWPGGNSQLDEGMFPTRDPSVFFSQEVSSILWHKYIKGHFSKCKAVRRIGIWRHLSVHLQRKLHRKSQNLNPSFKIPDLSVTYSWEWEYNLLRSCVFFIIKSESWSYVFSMFQLQEIHAANEAICLSHLGFNWGLINLSLSKASIELSSIYWKKNKNKIPFLSLYHCHHILYQPKF